MFRSSGTTLEGGRRPAARNTGRGRWSTYVVGAIIAILVVACTDSTAANPSPIPSPSHEVERVVTDPDQAIDGGDPDRPAPGRTGAAALVPDAPALLTPAHNRFQVGDLLISNGPGQVQWRLSDGTLNSTIQAIPGGNVSLTGMAFDAGGNVYVTDFGDFGGGGYIKISSAGTVLSRTSSSSFAAPESAVTDGFGRLYVGQAGSGAGNFGPNTIHKLDLAGNELTVYTVVEDHRGADWIDLASDRCTIRYTSEGSLVKRFNVCTGAQLSDFAGGLHTAYAIRILPDGGAIVADTDRIVRLNASGSVIQTYDAAGEDLWFALDLGADGTSFWAGNNTTANVYRFDLNSGAILTSFHAGSGILGGIAVFNPSRFAFAGPPEPQTYGNGPGAHGSDPTDHANEPVNTATGNYTSSVLDAHLPGRGLSLDFTRSYNSLDATVGVFGRGWTHSFAGGLVINGDNSATVTVEGGARLTFPSNGSGGFIAPAGVNDTLVVAGGGYDLRRRDQRVYHFDAAGLLASERDRNGNTITLTYTSGKLTRVTDPGGRAIDLAYNGTGQLASLAVPPSRSVVYTYDASGRLETVTDTGGGVTTYAYDAANRLASIRDANNHFVVRNTYGADGRITQQLDARDNPTTFSWDPVTSTSTMTDARTGTWIDVYQSNVLTEMTDPLGNVTRFLYDPAFRLVAITDRNGNTTSMEYDTSGNLIRRGAPGQLGYPAEEWTYNATNDVLTSKDRRGNVTTYTYNGTGNRLTMVGPAPINALTSYTYDPAGTGLVFTVTDPRNKVTQFGYDAQGNLTSTTTPLGEKTTFGYDAAGRRTTGVEARGNVIGADPAQYTTTTTYNGLDQILTNTDPLGHPVMATYDLVGNRLTVQDANLHTTTWSYDFANHLASAKDADNKTTTYTYDAVGNLASTVDPNTHTTSYEYDLANRVTKETRPLGRIWTYEYDAYGNRTKVTDANGNATPAAGDGTTTMTYDALNRLKTITYSDATPAVSYSYDGNGNRTQMTDGVTTTYTYDANDHLTRVLRGTNAQLDFTYDAAGDMLTRAPLGGSSVTYTYDNDARLASMLVGGLTTTYAYDPASHLVTTTLPAANGYVETRTYDRAARLTEVKNAKGATTLSKSTYTLDNVGNPLTTVTTTGTITYTYDVNDRLAQACYTPSCTAPGDNFRRYTYDAVGNRLTEVRDTGTTTYAYDALDQLTGTSGPGGSVAYTYDQNGNATVAGAKTMTYNVANRLATAIVSGTTYTYSYDGDGNRVQTSTGTQSNKKTNFQWDPTQANPTLIRETDGNNSLLREYRYGRSLVSLQSGNSSFYYHLDGLGSVVNVTSSSGATLWTEIYQPFGEIKTETKGSNQAPTNLRKFAGEYLDPTGLYHLGARQYDPTIGRFLATDPAPPNVRAPYTSTYGYVANRPTNRVDPTGRDTYALCFGGQAVFGLGASINFCIVATTDLELGITVTPAGLAGTPNLGFGGGVQKSDAESINDLGQGFDLGGGSGGEGVGVGAEFFTGSGHCGQPVNGAEFSAQATVKGPPIEGHVGKSYTYIPLNIDFGGIFGDKDKPCSPK
jgi:RHS repeat-associated protein